MKRWFLFLFIAVISTVFLSKIFINKKEIGEDHYDFFKTISKKYYKTKRLYMRPISRDDINILCEYLYDKDVATVLIPEYFQTDGFESVEKAKNYLNRSSNKINMYNFAICLKNTNEPIGEISFNCAEKGVLWVSYWIGKKFQRKGYMSELIPMVKYVFDSCSDLSQTHIQCFKGNVGSYKICEKIVDLFMKDNKTTEKYKIVKSDERYIYRGDERTTALMFNIYKKK